MQHMVQKHAVHVLLADSVGQLRWLNRQACVFCGTARSQRCRRYNCCGSDTPLREIRFGDTFQDRRQPGHQDPSAGGGMAAGQHLPQNSQPAPPGEPLDDSPLPNCPFRDVVLIDRVGQQSRGPLRRRARKTQPHSDEQRGKRDCALTARGSISKATKGVVGGASQGSEKLDYSPHPAELGH